ncbi:hypothetical protein [Streptomyces sp. A1-5]|uniref:hypothetical protein n=1 Tax=Streptomyces sp. A1-5 TaxID=2738410 RepID=UPI001F16173C|nr:hypothetical protein [Streptomyces sp. A1-5]
MRAVARRLRATRPFEDTAPAAHAAGALTTHTRPAVTAQSTEHRALLAQSYLLATRILIKLDEQQHDWMAADRAGQTAEAADDRLLVAEAARQLAVLARKANWHDQALSIALAVAPHHLPSIERRARYCTDIAAALRRWGRRDECIRALLAAEHHVPEETHARPAVKTLVSGLLASGKKTTELRGLAARVGALI